jgi:WD40 repeat protein
MFFSDNTLKVWSMDGLSDNVTAPINLKAKAVVAAHDKDINCVAVAPNDSLVCSGSQVGIISYLQISLVFILTNLIKMVCLHC